MNEIKIGTILRPHGMKGELIVRFDRENPEKVLDLPFILIEKEMDVFEIAVMRAQKKQYILKLKGIDHISQAESLRGRSIYVDSWQEDELQEDEYFVEELIGIKVLDESERLIGHLHSIIESPANEIYVVEGPYGQVLIPAVSAFILSVSIPDRQMHVRLLEGMINED
jgi:16S rRNA processing protein RimM